jgi:hypothetical protein
MDLYLLISTCLIGGFAMQVLCQSELSVSLPQGHLSAPSCYESLAVTYMQLLTSGVAINTRVTSLHVDKGDKCGTEQDDVLLLCRGLCGSVWWWRKQVTFDPVAALRNASSLPSVRMKHLEKRANRFTRNLVLRCFTQACLHFAASARIA